MPGIANQSATGDARTTFETLANHALAGSRDRGIWRYLAREVRPNGSVAHEFTFGGATPTWKEFTGARVFDSFRKYAKRIPLKKFDKSIALDRADVEYDTDGSTGETLQRFLAGETFWDKMVLEKLVENPTGADGVALVSDSHPFASGGGTWDNETTAALSWSSFNTERARMRAVKDEFGEPLELEPRVLLVHPDEEEIALQIAQADSKPVSVGTAGAINTAGIGGAQLHNVFRGTVDVVVTSRVTSGDWYIVDPRYSPLVIVVWKEPTPVIVDDPESSDVVHSDQYIYMMVADATADGVQPWGIAGKSTN